MLRIGGAERDTDRVLPGGGESVSLSGMSEAGSHANDEGAAGGDAGPAAADVAGVPAGTHALGDTYRSHWADLCRYVLRSFGPGPPEPEDIAQGAFIRLSGVTSVVENVGSFLRKTARNLVIDHYRGSLRTSLVHRDVTILDGENADYSPEDVLASKEHLLLLNAAINNLKPKERVALLMHRIDGASFADIAVHLGVSHSGARLLVSRAFERCAAELGDALGDVLDQGERP
jgi:RNA polymerase sigma factor (sigma-70 family)